MISKVITGRSFSGVCRYICSDQKRAVVLETEGVRGHDYKLMSSDFETQHALRPRLNKAVFHGILSFYPGENISDVSMVQLSKEYLLKMGITETQFAITKHLDKNHPHVHIIANMVNNKGEAIKDSWIGLKGKKVAQQLTAKYGLKEALTKNLALTHLERLNEREATRYVLYQAISQSILNCKNLDDLKEQLKKHDIETLYKYKGQSEELQGISFRIGDFKYKGSEVDRRFSVKQLQRILHEQKCRQAIQQPRLNLQESRSVNQSRKQDDRIKHSNLLHELLKSERHSEQLPQQWKIKKQKKRKPNSLH
jgi:hypothetical protein